MTRVLVIAATIAGLCTGALVTAAARDDDDRRLDPPPSFVAPTRTAVAEPVGGVLLAWVSGGLPDGFADRVRADGGLSAVTVVLGDTVQLRADAGRTIPLEAIAVDCASWAAVVPLADAALPCELHDDEALLGETSARLRGVDAGSALVLANGRTIRVAGVVPDEVVGAAELVLPMAGAAAAGVRTERYVLALYEGHRAAAETRIRSLTDEPLRVRGPGETPWLRHGDAVLPQSLVKDEFGEFSGSFQPGGRIDIDPRWSSANIVTVDLPVVGRVPCHRAVAAALEDTVTELVDRGLLDTVDRQATGCWNPRTIAGTDQPSRHAWGIAFDLVPLPHDIDAVVEVFERHGFTWGGRWLERDAVHFEYIR